MRGAGPALVMLHGWAMHGDIFEPLSTLLERHYTLHLVDLPGHGRSGGSGIPLALHTIAQDLAVRVPRATWLGWSLGGLIALHAAQVLPGAVRGLVMIGASARFVRADDWPLGMPPSIFEGFADELRRDYRACIDRFLLLEAQGSDHAREELRILRERVFAHGEPAPEVLARGLELLASSDLRSGLASLSPPSLWLAGRRDRLVRPEAMQQCAQLAALSDATFSRVEHGGHAPFLTHAREVAATIREFLQTLAP